MSKLTDKQWVELTRILVEYTHQGLRLGQAYMNALNQVNPEIHKQVMTTNNDCYYDDDKILNLINFLSDNQT